MMSVNKQSLLDFINDGIRVYTRIQEIALQDVAAANPDEYRGKVKALRELKFFIEKGEFDI